jgi:beta-phosphoglucomutase-like phosphatase (HAD superfamily)
VTVRAIVFDFDGVIANSEPLHYRAFHDVLAEAGADLSEKDYYDRYLGYDDVGVFKTVATDRGLAWDAEGIATLVARKAARIDVLERNMSLLFPGADAAVRRAAAAVPIAIASGALGAEIRKVLERERLAKYFTVIVAAEDTPVSKPAPDPYLRAVALLAPALGGAIAAADVVAVEDSPWGLQSARAAGLRTVAVAHTYAASALDADLVIGSIGDLDIDRLKRL